MFGASQVLVAPPRVLSAADFVLRDGTTPLSANWDAGSFQIRAETFQSDVATGTAPFVVASTTLVANLNADLLDGNEASAFATASHAHSAADITSGTLAAARGGLGLDASAIAKGGLFRGTAAGTIGILVAGTDGQVLTMQADGSASWEDAVGGAIDAIELKASVKAASTANLTLSGEQTIDGVACVAGDRVLAKNQTTASENGIYVVGAYGWTRAADYAAGMSAAATFGHIQQGTTNGDKKWLCTTNSGSDTIGTHSLSYTLTASVGSGVSGPGSSTDNAIARWDGTGGGTLQNSGVTIDDNGRILAVDGTNGGVQFSGTTNYIKSVTQYISLEVTVSGTASLQQGDSGTLFSGAVVFLGATATSDLDWENTNYIALTLSASVSPAFTSPKNRMGGTAYPAILTLKIIQGGTGSYTITWPASVKWAGGTPPTLSTAVGAVDLIQFVFDGTNYHGSVLALDSQ